jgi:hypothetical protein
MNYEFYGKNLISTYKPVKFRNPFDYSLVSYYVDLNKKLSSWDLFHFKNAISKEFSNGEKIEISGENLVIENITYDIDRDIYKCYTNKILSDTLEGMTEKEAETELLRIKKYDKSFIGRIKELKYQF